MHPVRRFKSVSIKKKATILVAGALVVGAAGYAGAQWILNTGTGNVPTAQSAWSVAAGAITGGSLAPSETTGCTGTCGSINQAITVTNISGSTCSSGFGCNFGLLYVTPSIESDGTGVWDSLLNSGTGAYLDSCPAADFTISQQNGQSGDLVSAATGGTGPAMSNSSPLTTYTIPAGATENLTFTINLASNAPAACQGIDVGWSVTAS